MFATPSTQTYDQVNRWFYEGDAIVTAPEGSYLEHVAAYAAALQGEPGQHHQVEVLVRHEDGKTSANMGLVFIVDGVKPIDRMSGDGSLGGAITDGSGDRVDLVYTGGVLKLAIRTKVRQVDIR